MDKPPSKLKVAPRPAEDAIADAPKPVMHAIKALNAGTASAHQQQLALQWIVREACGKGTSFPYHPTDRATAFALGRYFVADLIVGLIDAEFSSLRRASDGLESETRSSNS